MDGLAHIFLLPVASLVVAALTFFTGFGLGSLLLPLFVWQFGAVAAVPAVAIIHLLNNVYKVALTAKHADRSALLRFGIPAMLSAIAGAWLFGRFTALPDIHLLAFGMIFALNPVKFVVGLSIALIAIIEASGWLKSLSITEKWLPLGGIVSGFFGGLSGHQGAFRTLFLVKAGLARQTLIGTGAVIACIIDVARITFYCSIIPSTLAEKLPVVILCAIAAFVGTTLGNRYLKKMEQEMFEKVISLALVIFGICSALGFI